MSSRGIGAAELAAALGLPPPTDEQRTVIESGMRPSAVVAGAGSGKTETMASRVVWLVANELVEPEQVLGLTFTRKAAAELSQRIRQRLAQWRRVLERDRPGDLALIARLQAQEPTVLTYAAYAGRLVSEQGLRVGAETDARLLSPAVLWQIADEVVRGWDKRLTDFGAIPSLVHWVIALSGQLADHLARPEEVERFCAAAIEHFYSLPPGERARSEEPGKYTKGYVTALRQRQALVEIVAAFRARKRELRAVDFADQMVLAAELARLPEVARLERLRYRAVLLDEYQDTGHAQVQTLIGLFGDGHPVTAVGDPFQSIYGWRGASAGTMGSFAGTFRRADGTPATVHPLATSWRNDRRILEAANRVSRELRTSEVTLALRARPDAPDGTVTTAFLETVEDEAAWVAERIGERWHALPPAERTAAVLVRRRSQLPFLAQALRGAGLPVEIVGLGGLLTTPEVGDVAATLRVLGERRPGGALMRLLTGARWRIGARDLSQLSERARWLAHTDGGRDAERSGGGDTSSGNTSSGDTSSGDTSSGDIGGGDVGTAESARRASGEDDLDTPNLLEALDDPGPADRYSPAGYARLLRLRRELRRLRTRLAAPLAELVAEVELAIGVGIEVDARPDRTEVGRVHLDRFLEVAAQFAAEAGDNSLRAFLAFLEAAEDEENGLEAGDVVVATERVQLLTVHGAKGLEWDIVAVPGLSGKLFPAEPRSHNWTRARQQLPGPLRGDRDSLPELEVRDAETRADIDQRLRAHEEEIRQRHFEEERRLAYVAMTRARSALFACGHAWENPKQAREPSPFLREVAEYAGYDTWFEPGDAAVNPRTVEPIAAAWPVDPLGERRAATESGAALVRGAAGTLPGLSDSADARVRRWRRDVELMLAERDRLRGSATVAVELPANLSVSQLVELARDPRQLAERLHRPMPAEPAPWARRGTAFHQWLEQRWSMPTLLDVDQLPGAADDTAHDEPDLVRLQQAFGRSEWAARTPAEVEVPFDMAIDEHGTTIRGRMDAVFGSPEQGWDVVDWKTGSRPTGAAAEAAAVQLAAYRLAWARISGIGDDALHTVTAAFHYVASNETVRPADLLDAEGLRVLIRTVG